MEFDGKVILLSGCGWIILSVRSDRVFCGSIIEYLGGDIDLVGNIYLKRKIYV